MTTIDHLPSDVLVSIFRYLIDQVGFNKMVTYTGVSKNFSNNIDKLVQILDKNKIIGEYFCIPSIEYSPYFEKTPVYDDCIYPPKKNSIIKISRTTTYMIWYNSIKFTVHIDKWRFVMWRGNLVTYPIYSGDKKLLTLLA